MRSSLQEHIVQAEHSCTAMGGLACHCDKDFDPVKLAVVEDAKSVRKIAPAGETVEPNDSGSISALAHTRHLESPM